MNRLRGIDNANSLAVADLLCRFVAVGEKCTDSAPEDGMRAKNRLSVGWTDGSAIGGPFYEKSTHGPNCWTLREPHPRFGGFSSTKSFFRRA